jgi:hypothetical protein
VGRSAYFVWNNIGTFPCLESLRRKNILLVVQLLNSSWLLCGAGALFCAGGAYLFKRNVFENDKTITAPILIILGGIILIAIGTAKYFNVM